MLFGTSCTAQPASSAVAPTTVPPMTTAPALETIPTVTTSSDTSTHPPGTTAPVGTCGVERWAVKTAADPLAQEIDTTDVQDTTVSALDAIPRPPDPSTRVAPVETTVYRVHATLTEYKAESDGDVHLLLPGGTGRMITEIPSPSCDAGSIFAAQIRDARAAFDARHHEKDTYVYDGEQVTVTGVGFFDVEHGQRGTAPNNIELHPVVALSFDGP